MSDRTIRAIERACAIGTAVVLVYIGGLFLSLL
jgi:hypothetical protein